MLGFLETEFLQTKICKFWVRLTCFLDLKAKDRVNQCIALVVSNLSMAIFLSISELRF